MVLFLFWKANAATQERSVPTALGAHCLSLCLGSEAAFSSVSFLLDRVQKEQLAAIFKLMKDNKETFGEMSDGALQEQLRLYDM